MCQAQGDRHLRGFVERQIKAADHARGYIGRFTLQTLPAHGAQQDGQEQLAQASGFSLHAGVATEAGERAKLERLCR